MTFKHISFSDSETMRSLTKVALDKGIIKPESHIEKIVKKASGTPKKLDLSVSASFDENVLKLCAGLRSRGLASYADEIETKYVALKRASVESKLVEEAHPEGSPEVAEAADDAGVVENLNEQQVKVEEVALSAPTGKLASKNQILKMVRAALNVTANENDLSTVNPMDISKKFRYMADYLSKYFVDAPPSGETLPPVARDFYGTLGVWRDLAQTIAGDLNSSQAMPIQQAMQIVKNRLQNGFKNSKQYVQKVNNVSDVDKLVSWILTWAEDNNPMKKSASSEGNRSFLVRTAALSEAQAAGIQKLFDAVAQALSALNSSLNTLADKNADREMVSRIQRDLTRNEDYIAAVRKNPHGNLREILSVISNLQKLAPFLRTREGDHSRSAWDNLTSDNGLFTMPHGEVAERILSSAIRNLQAITYNLQNAKAGEGPGEPISVPAFNTPKAPAAPTGQANTQSQKGSLTVAEAVAALNKYSTALKTNLLDKEAQIYAPVPDNATDLLEKMDRYFDRGQALYDQLLKLSKQLSVYSKDVPVMSAVDFSRIANDYSMFSGQSFASVQDLDAYLAKAYAVVMKILQVAK